MSQGFDRLTSIAERLERLKNPIHFKQIVYTSLTPSHPGSSSSGEKEEQEMAANVNLSMRQLVAIIGLATPLCITYPTNGGFELESGMLHYLPIFHGFAGEDPHTHLKGFHMVCLGMKLEGVSEENQVKNISLLIS
ncbi:hypothetical protein PS2_022460 [Malus domestica]